MKKSWNSAFNAQGWRVIIVVVHVGAVKIYVAAAVEALRKKRKDGSKRDETHAQPVLIHLSTIFSHKFMIHPNIFGLFSSKLIWNHLPNSNPALLDMFFTLLIHLVTTFSNILRVYPNPSGGISSIYQPCHFLKSTEHFLSIYFSHRILRFIQTVWKNFIYTVVSMRALKELHHFSSIYSPTFSHIVRNVFVLDKSWPSSNGKICAEIKRWIAGEGNRIHVRDTIKLANKLRTEVYIPTTMHNRILSYMRLGGT